MCLLRNRFYLVCFAGFLGVGVRVGAYSPPPDPYKGVPAEIKPFLPRGPLNLPLRPAPPLPPLATGAPPRYRMACLPRGFVGEALNNRGQVAGGLIGEKYLNGSEESTRSRAALCSVADGTLHFLSSRATDRDTDGDEQAATAINDAGVAVGLAGANGSGAISFSYFDARIWEPGRPPRTFLPVPEHGNASAVAINRQGDILVNAGYGSAMDMQRYIEYVGERPTETTVLAFLWRSGKITPLGIWDTHAINDRGEILATAPRNSDHTPGAWFTPRRTDHVYCLSGARVWDIGNGQPGSINNRSQIIGNDAVGEEATWSWLWSRGMRHRLPRLPGTKRSVAAALNDRGQIVGDCDGRLCVWQNGRVYDLSRYLHLSSGWTLGKAMAINNQGIILVLVSRGRDEIEERSILLVPRGE